MKNNNLPRLRVFCPCFKLVQGEGWVGGYVDVEVCSIHFGTNRMRVRTIEKIHQVKSEKPQIYSWDMEADDFYNSYRIINRKYCEPQV